jgi:HK97 family phage major capsid protein
MAVTVKELKEKRAASRITIQKIGEKIRAEGRSMNADERAEFDKASNEFETYTKAIEDQRALAKFDVVDDGDDEDRTPGRHDTDTRSKRGQLEERRAAPTEEDRALAVQAWLRKTNGLPLKKRHAEACQKVGINPGAKHIDIRLSNRPPKFDRDGNVIGRESRDMGKDTGAGGGFLVAQGFSNQFERALKLFGGPRNVADVMRTSNGAPMPWPTMDDTSNVGEQIAENTAVASQDATIASVTFGAYKFSSKLIPVSYELMEDSAFDMVSIVGEIAGERIGRITSTRYTSGNGSTQPQGLVTASTLGRTAASATALSTVDLIQLRQSVDPAYRSDPRCGFMMHNSILTLCMLLVDSQGRPIFLESYRDGEVDRILGSPVTLNQDMASTAAATNRTVLFGNFSKFKIRDVGALRLRRLEERYAEKDQTGFIAFMRSDSKLIDAGGGSVKHIVH